MRSIDGCTRLSIPPHKYDDIRAAPDGAWRRPRTSSKVIPELPGSSDRGFDGPAAQSPNGDGESDQQSRRCDQRHPYPDGDGGGGLRDAGNVGSELGDAVRGEPHSLVDVDPRNVIPRLGLTEGLHPSVDCDVDAAGAGARRGEVCALPHGCAVAHAARPEVELIKHAIADRPDGGAGDDRG